MVGFSSSFPEFSQVKAIASSGRIVAAGKGNKGLGNTTLRSPDSGPMGGWTVASTATESGLPVLASSILKSEVWSLNARKQ